MKSILALLLLLPFAFADNEVTYTIYHYSDAACDIPSAEPDTLTWKTNTCVPFSPEDNTTLMKVTECLTDISGFTVNFGTSCDNLNSEVTFKYDECVLDTDSNDYLMLSGDFACDITVASTIPWLAIGLAVAGLVVAGGILYYFTCRNGRTRR